MHVFLRHAAIYPHRNNVLARQNRGDRLLLVWRVHKVQIALYLRFTRKTGILCDLWAYAQRNEICCVLFALYLLTCSCIGFHSVNWKSKSQGHFEWSNSQDLPPKFKLVKIVIAVSGPRAGSMHISHFSHAGRSPRNKSPSAPTLLYERTQSEASKW